MKKNLLALASSLIILCVLTIRYLSDFETFRAGQSLLLPVWVEEVKTDLFSSKVRIRYYNFIPVENLIKETGTVVVNRFDDGQVDFVAKSVNQRLHPRELLLKYTLVPPSFLGNKNQSLNIRFASSELRFFNEETEQLSAIRYAVVHVNDIGEALLVGLADNMGTQLIKGIAFSDFHTP